MFKQRSTLYLRPFNRIISSKGNICTGTSTAKMDEVDG